MMRLPTGFRLAGVAAGIKKAPGALDVALVVSDTPATGVGIFTTNRIAAAPVLLSKQRVPSSTARGIVINAGNANAATGSTGFANAEAAAAVLARHLDCHPTSVLVASTGVIGRPLPIDQLLSGVDAGFAALAATPEALDAAGRAIMTTDTKPKFAHVATSVDGREYQVVGFAKGAAMIAPNMATMLGFVLSDAAVSPETAAGVLKRAAEVSFHAISVEGHTSTNDTVLLMANGASEAAITSSHLADFEQAVTTVCRSLAEQIIADAEGATKVLEITVRGAADDAEAKVLAQAIAHSPLVKTAFFGNDPNWGRIVSAAGYAGVPFDQNAVTLRVNGTLLFEQGQPTTFDAELEANRLRASQNIPIEFLLDRGSGACRFVTCDLTTEYVRLNADYTT